MYPTSDTFATGSSGGAFSSPASRSYAKASITTPLAQNLYVAAGSVAVTTTASIISGFGSSASGPSMSVQNSYATGVQSFTPDQQYFTKQALHPLQAELKKQTFISVQLLVQVAD